MPTNAVRGPEGEEQWERAKQVVIDQYGDISKSDPEKFYSLTTTIYKSMCSKHKCTPKREVEEAVEPRPVGKVQKAILDLAKKYAEHGRESYNLSEVPWKIFPWDFGDSMKSAIALEKKGLINIKHGQGMEISLPKKQESVVKIGMRRLIEAIEKKNGIDWTLEFPFHEVQQKMSDLYDESESIDGRDSAPVPDSIINRVKKVYGVFASYMKKVKDAMKDDESLSEHYDLLKKSDESFKRLIARKNKSDFVNVNARLVAAHTVLYAK